jgi:hypothetical protein
LQALAWFEGLPTVARAITPSIQIVASPPVLASLSNFTVLVRYTAAESAVAVINLLDHGYAWHGGGTVIVGRGDGLLDLLVTVQPGVTNGNYLLECFLSDSSTNWQNTMARSQNSPVVVADSVAQDRINVIPQAAFLSAGEVFRFAVSYAAPAHRDLHIDLFDANTNFLAGALQPVGPGSGVHEMTISHPGAQPGEQFVTAFITPSGQSWNDALAWSADRSVTVVGMDYQRWLEAHWGVLLGNDALHPQQDADGDGASNDSERIAHTAPLDAADVLRLSTSIVGGQIILSWRSAGVRQYQLFQRGDVALESWTPLGAIIDGTGDTVQVSIDLASAIPQKFFRLQVSER